MEKKLIHVKNIEIRWGDMDGYGHVNNTNYFLYAQEARFAMLEQMQINYPETIVVETWFLDIVDNKKLIFEHVIKSKLSNKIYAILTATNVWYDFINKTATEIPSDIKTII